MQLAKTSDEDRKEDDGERDAIDAEEIYGAYSTIRAWHWCTSLLHAQAVIDRSI